VGLHPDVVLHVLAELGLHDDVAGGERGVDGLDPGSQIEVRGGWAA
jgi:hypothetical protein